MTLLADPIVQTILLGVAGALGTLAGAAVMRLVALARTRLAHQLDADQMAMVDSIAAKAVRYVYAVSESPDGQARFEEAAKMLAGQAEGRGIPLTEDQIRLAIEAAYVDFKIAVTPLAEQAG